jgi:hypothetical protein
LVDNEDAISVYDYVQMRVSAIKFADGIYPEDSFNLSTYSNKSEMLTRLQNLSHEAGPFTATNIGIRYMRTVQMAEARPCARKAAIILTDGNSQDIK